jgi:hypothetical protein
MSKYRSPFSVSRRQTVFVNENDPRAKNIGQTRSRLGADIIVKPTGKVIPEVYGPQDEYFFGTFATSQTYYSTNQILPKDAKVDNKGYIYTISSQAITGATNAYLNKYDQKGNIIWSRTIPLLGASTSDLAVPYNCLKIDDNYIYVVLNNQTTDLYSQYILLKFDTDGLLKWSKKETYQSTVGTKKFTSINDIEVATDGSIYIVGRYGRNTTSLLESTNMSTLIIKYNSSGTIVWQKAFTGLTQSLGFYGTSGTGNAGKNIAIDQSGYIYITSARPFNVGGTTFYTIVLTKLDSSGTVIWQKQISGGFIQSSANSRLIEFDSSGNLYILGNYSTGFNGSMLTKINSSSALVWTQGFTFTISATLSSFAAGLQIAKDGSIYVTPTSAGIVTKLSSSGTILNSVAIQDTATNHTISTAGMSIGIENKLVSIGRNLSDSSSDYSLSVALLPIDSTLSSTYNVPKNKYATSVKQMTVVTDTAVTLTDRSGGMTITTGSYLTIGTPTVLIVDENAALNIKTTQYNAWTKIGFY